MQPGDIETQICIQPRDIEIPIYILEILTYRYTPGDMEIPTYILEILRYSYTTWGYLATDIQPGDIEIQIYNLEILR